MTAGTSMVRTVSFGGGFAVHPFFININSSQYPQSSPILAFWNVLALSGGRDASAGAACRRAASIVQSTRHPSKNLIERSLRVQLPAGACLRRPEIQNSC